MIVYALEFAKDFNNEGVMNWERYPKTFTHKGHMKDVVAALIKEGYTVRYLCELED